MSARVGLGLEAWTGHTRMYEDREHLPHPEMPPDAETSSRANAPHAAAHARDSARAAIWWALSDLYLDTDPALFHDAAARVLAASPYDATTLQRILIEEVHPALAFNLCGVAGVWEGFDPDWLRERVRRVRARPRWRRALWACLRGHPRRQWAALAPKIAAVRSGIDTSRDA